MNEQVDNFLLSLLGPYFLSDFHLLRWQGPTNSLHVLLSSAKKSHTHRCTKRQLLYKFETNNFFVSPSILSRHINTSIHN